MSHSSITTSQIHALQTTVLSRYDQHARVLPWRLTDDPYHILVSETMLCQTQVDRVIRYYERFVAHFPRIQDLAYTDRKTLLTLRSGLGYNNRALRLQASALQICQIHDGIVPYSYDALITLPGVGDYIASAILAFAYHQDVAVLDTNIRRVLIHRFHLPQDCNLKLLRQIALQTLPHGQATVRRNAMMDYGALVLTAHKTNIRPKYKQSVFAGSTRQVRSGILRYLLHHPSLSYTMITQQRPHAQLDQIIGKMLEEGLIAQQGDVLILRE